eukprot:scaffold414940_cov28-Prasinocladus_malaysianus.AAC.1
MTARHNPTVSYCTDFGASCSMNPVVPRTEYRWADDEFAGVTMNSSVPGGVEKSLQVQDIGISLSSREYFPRLSCP